MSYNEIRTLEAILYSEAIADFPHDLHLLAHALVAHYEWDLSCSQIEWIVEGVMAERAYKDGYNPESAVYGDELLELGY